MLVFVQLMLYLCMTGVIEPNSTIEAPATAPADVVSNADDLHFQYPKPYYPNPTVETDKIMLLDYQSVLLSGLPIASSGHSSPCWGRSTRALTGVPEAGPPDTRRYPLKEILRYLFVLS